MSWWARAWRLLRSAWYFALGSIVICAFGYWLWQDVSSRHPGARVYRVVKYDGVKGTWSLLSSDRPLERRIMLECWGLLCYLPVGSKVFPVRPGFVPPRGTSLAASTAGEFLMDQQASLSVTMIDFHGEQQQFGVLSDELVKPE